DETTGVADEERAEEIRVRRYNEILDQLIHGVKPRHTFVEAAVGYAKTLTPGSTQCLAVIGRERKSDRKISPCLVLDFPNQYVDEVDQAAVDEVIKRRFAKRKPNTIDRNLITPLEGVLSWAAAREWCKPRQFAVEKYRDAPRRWASWEECARLIV